MTSDPQQLPQTTAAARATLAKSDELVGNAEALLRNIDEELMVLDREDTKIAERGDKEVAKVVQKLDLSTLQFLKNTAN